MTEFDKLRWIQLRRTKGWRMAAAKQVVSRKGTVVFDLDLFGGR
jgi:hypothetical protein